MLVSADPQVFSYETEGLTTEIPDAWRQQIEAELRGSPVETAMHVRPVADGDAAGIPSLEAGSGGFLAAR